MIRIITLIIGIATLAGSGWWYQKTSTFIAHAQHAAGKVVDFEKRYSKSTSHGQQQSSQISIGHVSLGTGSNNGQGNLMYYPVIEFPSNGKPVRFTDNLGSSRAMYNVGDPVEVLYLPEHPTQASINNFWSLWMGQVVLAILGTLFTAASLLVKTQKR